MFPSSPQSVPRVILLTPPKNTNNRSLQVKAQSMRDEGRSSNLVDSNIKVLKERIEEVRAKERLERMSCSRRNEYGWNYASTAYNFNHKNTKQEKKSSEYFETLGLAGGVSGLTILTATALLCFVSFMTHFHL